ncbi:MAG TPA: esterase-like activity of phytase family protein [Solimonas sp.]|nr:esterase-like activity of phytase family protein [Solimonas sp.]
MTRIHTAGALLLALSTLGLSACSDDDDTGATTPTIQQGVLLDSFVAGLEYSRSSAPSTLLLTDAQGRFDYLAGETLSFRLGGIALGSAGGKAKLSIVDLVVGGNSASPAVINRARLLQSLDADGDPANGIQIDAATRTALAGKTLDVNATAADFETAFAAQLPDHSLRSAALAREHLESTLAREFGQTGGTVVTGTPAGDVSVTRYVLDDSDKARFRVPYPGSDAGVKAAFPDGFFVGFGSGLTLKARNADGSLDFWFVTDRGPNGDSPDYKDATIAERKSKAFPAPAYNPKFGVLRLKDGALQPLAFDPLLTADGGAISGRPLPDDQIGASLEVALTETLAVREPGFDLNGLDPEGVAVAGSHLWLCDEYGPFLFKLDPATGRIVSKLKPTQGLPELLKFRRPNRGFEGVATTPNGKVYAIVQSPLEMPKTRDAAGVEVKKFSDGVLLRLVEHDPATQQTRMFAYTHDLSLYARGRDVKLGDLVALSDTRFLLIEQGAQVDGLVHNLVVLIDLAGATEISSITTTIAAHESAGAEALGGKLHLDYLKATADLADPTKVTAVVTPVKKKLLFDLKSEGFGWLAEKAEGLARVDDQTFAIANDNDFGVSAKIAKGKDGATTLLKGDDCKYDGATQTFSGDLCPADGSSYAYRLGRGSSDERPSRLWLFRLPKKFSEYNFE